MVLRRLLVDCLTTFPIKDNPLFNNGPKSLSKSLPDCTILCNWVFESFILPKELFAKASQSFET